MIDDEVKHRSLRFGFSDDLIPEYYQYNLIVMLKGLEMEVLAILTILTSMDLSCNRFHGSIPEDIGNLKFLLILNMSHNDFSGSIPSSFGNLEMLESLDLSRNQLSGEIPTNLAPLTFLAVLNLSQNHLVGKIPHAQQFLTFTNSSFLGNPGLCGLPLSTQCEVLPESLRFASDPTEMMDDDFTIWTWMEEKSLE
eukprot:TRINITY_DN5237_c0_g3_i2.p1 TRINITY_DN5237_c0_g3~~TRINITY_DN5237_c0_g3_i2.p1  ORF type:complete len:195 (+),score=27.37 TRINITY_DN5237_c0_g3_i2:694-1278(+)